MASVHFVNVRVTHNVKAGGLRCDVSETKLFYFDTDNEALAFCEAVKTQPHFKVIDTGLCQSWSVASNLTDLANFSSCVKLAMT